MYHSKNTDIVGSILENVDDKIEALYKVQQQLEPLLKYKQDLEDYIINTLHGLDMWERGRIKIHVKSDFDTNLSKLQEEHKGVFEHAIGHIDKHKTITAMTKTGVPYKVAEKAIGLALYNTTLNERRWLELEIKKR